MQKWCLKVRLLDTTESAYFDSRQDALEQARGIIEDYGGSVEVTLIYPSGQTQNIRRLMWVWLSTRTH